MKREMQRHMMGPLAKIERGLIAGGAISAITLLILRGLGI